MNSPGGRAARAAWRIIPPALIPILAVACFSRTGQAPYPHESLLSIIAEMKISLRRDPYREPPGRDLEGQNIYKVTLARLDAVGELADDSYNDVLAFARAECMERLGRWPGAVAEYGSVIGSGTSLAAPAGERRAWAVRMAEAGSETTDSLTLTSYVNVLDLRRVSLLRLREEKPPFPYDSLILHDLEGNLQTKARFLFDNRYLIPRGAEDAVETARKLIEENPKSWRFGENWLLLAGIYEALARDYAQFNDPTGGGFEIETWSAWVDQAREACQRAAQADGDPAKPEGQARLRALDAYALRIMETAR